MATNGTQQAAVNPYQAPKAAVDDPVAATGEPLFFPVGVSKLAVMSVVTFNLYEVYWFYKNWKCLQRQGEKVNAPIRAVFYPLTAYWLFKKIREHPGGEALQAGALAAAILVLSMLWRLPDPWWMISVASFVPLLSAQRAANAINAQAAPQADANTRYSGWNIAGIIFGVLWWILVFIGLFLPET